MNLPSGRRRAVDPRGGRLVAVIECVLNQNARDAGAACAPAMTQDAHALNPDFLPLRDADPQALAGDLQRPEAMLVPADA